MHFIQLCKGEHPIKRYNLNHENVCNLKGCVLHRNIDKLIHLFITIIIFNPRHFTLFVAFKEADDNLHSVLKERRRGKCGYFCQNVDALDRNKFFF